VLDCPVFYWYVTVTGARVSVVQLAVTWKVLDASPAATPPIGQ
jgi:hypothetical protein